MIKDKLSVVIIDDDRDDQFFISDSLRKNEGFGDIEAFLGGAEALAWLRSGAALPHLIITDVKMPLMTGMEILDTLKKDAALAAIPVILFSTSSFGPDIEYARSKGAIGYITKPYHIQGFQEIARAIHRMVSDPQGADISNDPSMKWFSVREIG